VDNQYFTSVREWVEFAAAWLLLKLLGALPRPLARAAAVWLVRAAYGLRPGLRRVAWRNLALAFPDWDARHYRRVISGMLRQVGWMAAEFAHFPRYDRRAIERLVVLDGFENFQAALRQGRGVLVLTGHFSAWELAPFAQACYGYPMAFLARRIENPRVDRLVNRYRSLAGNRPVEKNRSARTVLGLLRQGQVVGVLLDHNTLPEEGVFVDFFGIPACTSSGLARMARRTGAPVVPGFLLWDARLGRYRLRFDPPVELAQTQDEVQDVRENTARFTKVIEAYVRQYPEQWLWVHKRWKTRPPGAPPLY
jgi:KDO2-lipid IV(A) lauroyltransferase